MALRVGVVGGGQLARMMIAPAVELGVELRVLAEEEGMSAALAAPAVGDYRDAATVLAFARDVDVLTFDHEHVPQEVLALLVAEGVAVHPGPDALRFAQDKLLMRARLQELGMPQPDWAAVTGAVELQAFIDDHGGQAVVKTPRGGYDGKGVRVVSAGTEAEDWFAVLAEDARGGALLAEEVRGQSQLFLAALFVAQLHNAIGDHGAKAGFLDRFGNFLREEILIAKGRDAREGHFGAGERHSGADVGGDQRQFRFANGIVPAFHGEQALTLGATTEQYHRRMGMGINEAGHDHMAMELLHLIEIGAGRARLHGTDAGDPSVVKGHPAGGIGGIAAIHSENPCVAKECRTHLTYRQ